MSDGFWRKMETLKARLAEAYEHYFEHSDGCCKSSEGVISIHYTSPFYWRDGDDPPAIEVYSYVFGPSRSHWFKTIDEALEAVTKWRDAELATEYDQWGDPVE